MEKYYSRTTPQ